MLPIIMAHATQRWAMMMKGKQSLYTTAEAECLDFQVPAPCSHERQAGLLLRRLKYFVSTPDSLASATRPVRAISSIPAASRHCDRESIFVPQ